MNDLETENKSKWLIEGNFNSKNLCIEWPSKVKAKFIKSI